MTGLLLRLLYLLIDLVLALSRLPRPFRRAPAPFSALCKQPLHLTLVFDLLDLAHLRKVRQVLQDIAQSQTLFVTLYSASPVEQQQVVGCLQEGVFARSLFLLCDQSFTCLYRSNLSSQGLYLQVLHHQQCQRGLSLRLQKGEALEEGVSLLHAYNREHGPAVSQEEFDTMLLVNCDPALHFLRGVPFNFLRCSEIVQSPKAFLKLDSEDVLRVYGRFSRTTQRKGF